MQFSAWKRRGFAAALSILIGVFSACSSESQEELLKSARASAAKQDLKSAIVQLKAVLQRDPQSGEARFLLGKVLLESGEPAAAAIELERAHDLHFDDSVVVPMLLQALIGSGQAKQVTDRHLNTAVGNQEAQGRVKAMLAAAFGAQGLLERSELEARNALRLDPSNVMARVIVARLAAGRGQIGEALALTEAVLSEQPRQPDALFLKGELLWKGKGETASGVQTFEQILQTDPKYAAAHASLLQIAMQQGDTELFEKRLSALAAALPNSFETLMAQSQAALLKKDYARARDISQKLAQLLPNNGRVFHLAGAVELQSGSLVQAATSLTKAILLEPSLNSARVLLAQTYLRLGQPDRAIDALQPLLAGRSSSAVLSLAGEAELRSGRPALAEALFKRAAESDPLDPRLGTALALSQIAKGDKRAGLAELEQLAEGNSATFADLALISARLRQQDTAGALAAIDRLQRKQPDSATPYLLRGQVFLQGKDLAQARSNLERALTLEPDNLSVLGSLAQVDQLERKPQDATRRFEARLKRDPGNYQVLLALAELRRRYGAPAQEVEQTLTAAIKANPAEPGARLMLIAHFLTTRQLPRARDAADESAAVLPGDPQILEMRGRVQQEGGDLEQAIATFGKLVATFPQSQVALLRLAEAQARSRDFSGSETTLRKVLELNPKSPANRAMVQVMLGDKRPAAALEFARRFQREHTGDGLGYVLEADVHFAGRDLASAVDAMKAGLARTKSSAYAIRLQTMLSSMGRESEANQFATSWLKDHPRDAAFMVHLGAGQLAARDYPAAEARYRSALALEPTNATILNSMAWLMIEQGKKGGLELAMQADGQAPGQPTIMQTVALALKAEGRLGEALVWQRRAVSGSGDAPVQRLSLAKLLLESGDRSGAVAELKALSLLGSAFSGQSEVAALLRQAS